MSESENKRGYIIPIGGAEKKARRPVILARIVDLAREKSSGFIVVIPTASQSSDTGPRYVRVFKHLGMEEVQVISPQSRADCERADYLKALEKATAIFITGGNQLRLSTVIGGTPIADMIRSRNAEGVHIAGTSAGAAILSEHMIAGGPGGQTPTRYGVDLAAGLGLTNGLIIDQHFRQRDRIGRLIAAIFYSPFKIGIGIDEDTAAFINSKNEFEVVGSGGVTIIDPGDLQYSSTESVRPGRPVSLIGLKMHILTDGARFDMNTRSATPADKISDD